MVRYPSDETENAEKTRALIISSMFMKQKLLFIILPKKLAAYATLAAYAIVFGYAIVYDYAVVRLYAIV